MLRLYFLLCFVAAVIASTLILAGILFLAFTHMLNAWIFFGSSFGLLLCGYGAHEMLLSYRAEARSGDSITDDQTLPQPPGNQNERDLTSLRSATTNLFTTRLRTGMAMAGTAFVFALSLRGALHPSHVASGWLLPLGFLVHGWVLIAVNVMFYAYLCWLGFWFVYGTKGRERVVMAGWAVGLLISPLRQLVPRFTSQVRFVEALSLAVALVGVVSLLLHPQSTRPSVRKT